MKLKKCACKGKLSIHRLGSRLTLLLLNIATHVTTETTLILIPCLYVCTNCKKGSSDFFVGINKTLSLSSLPFYALNCHKWEMTATLCSGVRRKMEQWRREVDKKGKEVLVENEKKKIKDQTSKTGRNDEKMEWRSYRDTRWTHSPYMPMGWEDKWAKLAFIVYLLFLYERCSKATFLNITKCCFFYFCLVPLYSFFEGWKRSQALKRMNDKPQPEVFQTLSSITFPDAFWL